MIDKATLNEAKPLGVALAAAEFPKDDDEAIAKRVLPYSLEPDHAALTVASIKDRTMSDARPECAMHWEGECRGICRRDRGCG